MEELSIKGAETSRWDCVSLGEVMLRLDPGEGRIHTARQFQADRELTAGFEKKVCLYHALKARVFRADSVDPHRQVSKHKESISVRGHFSLETGTGFDR